MRRRGRRGSVIPVYVFIAVWIISSMTLDLYKLSGFLIAVAASVGLGIFIGNLLSASRRKKAGASAASDAPAQKAAPEPEKPEKSYGPEVDAVIADGKAAMKEMGRLYASIKDPAVRTKINELMRVSDKIVQDAKEDPSDVPQIRKFLNYYLPTTIKLLNAYDRMSDQGIEGDNLSKSMSSIEKMLDTAIAAFKKQLDSLFENQALDIETDIDIMNRMLSREGLTGESEWDELIAKAEKEQAAGAAAQKKS